MDAESSFAGKDSGVLVGIKLNRNQQCALAAKAGCNQGCISKTTASTVRSGILSLCSALVRPHLGTGFGASQYKKDMDHLEQGQLQAGAHDMQAKAEGIGFV